MLAYPVLAFTVDAPLPNNAQEQEAQRLFREIRCVVCQSESIGESQAEIAKDMRRMVREKIKEGATGDEIKTFLSSRYGDSVLMQPPFKYSTWLLWLAPLLFLIAGVVLAYRYFIKQSTL